MPAISLEDLLRSSIESVTKAFQEADLALHGEVANLSNAISRISNGTVTVGLEPVTEEESEVIYHLSVFGNGRREYLASFGVTPKGYPITYGQWWERQDGWVNPSELKDLSMLQACFQKMASNPDSPLVQKVAFLMRKGEVPF